MIIIKYIPNITEKNTNAAPSARCALCLWQCAISINANPHNHFQHIAYDLGFIFSKLCALVLVISRQKYQTLLKMLYEQRHDCNKKTNHMIIIRMNEMNFVCFSKEKIPFRLCEKELTYSFHFSLIDEVSTHTRRSIWRRMQTGLPLSRDKNDTDATHNADKSPSKNDTTQLSELLLPFSIRCQQRAAQFFRSMFFVLLKVCIIFSLVFRRFRRIWQIHYLLRIEIHKNRPVHRALGRKIKLYFMWKCVVFIGFHFLGK